MYDRDELGLRFAGPGAPGMILASLWKYLGSTESARDPNEPFARSGLAGALILGDLLDSGARRLAGCGALWRISDAPYIR